MEILFIKNLERTILKSVINKNACFYKRMDNFSNKETEIEPINFADPKREKAMQALIETYNKGKKEKVAHVDSVENVAVTNTVEEKKEQISKLTSVLESNISNKINKLENESDVLMSEMSDIQNQLGDCLNDEEKDSLVKQFTDKENRLKEIKTELNSFSGNTLKTELDVQNNEEIDETTNKKTKWHDLSFGLFNSKSEANIVLKEIQKDDFIKLSDEDKISKVQDILLDFITDNKNNVDATKFSSEMEVRNIAVSILENKKIIKPQESLNNVEIEEKNNIEEKQNEINNDEVDGEIKEDTVINITQEEINALNKPISEDLKLNDLEDDVKEYFAAQNRIKYLEQNSFEIGKSLISTTDNLFGNITKGLFYNTTKKLGYDIITNKNKIKAHVEDLKYDLLQKMFPRQKNLSQTELEDLLSKYSGGDKKIDKIKSQYDSICNKLEEYIKLTEQKEQAESIINEFEKDEFNIQRAKEQKDIIKSLDDGELLEEINEKNVDIVLSILEKKRFDKEKLERLWKNYGTIAKTITVASFAVLASTLALPVVAIGGATAMTFAGAYFGGKTAWKNIREGNGISKIVDGEKISKNGNRLAFDTEEFKNEENIEELKTLLAERIKKTKDINNESKLAGVITGSIAVGAGMLVRNIIGSINNNSVDTTTNNNINTNSNNNVHDNWENYKVASVIDNKSNIDSFTPTTHPESFVELSDSKNDIDEFYSAISKHYNGNEVAHALIGGSKEKGLLRNNMNDYIYTNSDGKKFIDLQKIDQYIVNNNEKTAALVNNAKAHPEWFDKQNINNITEKVNVNNTVVDTNITNNSTIIDGMPLSSVAEELPNTKSAINDYLSTLDLPDNRKLEILNDLNSIINTSKSYEEAQFKFMEFFDRNSSSNVNLDALNTDQLANFNQLKKVFTETQLTKDYLGIKDGSSDSRLTSFYDTFGRENLVSAYRNNQPFEEFYKERFPKALADDPLDRYSYNQYLEQYKKITGIDGVKKVDIEPQNIASVRTEDGLATKTIVENTEIGTKTTTIKEGTLSGDELEKYNKVNGFESNAEKARAKMFESQGKNAGVIQDVNDDLEHSEDLQELNSGIENKAPNIVETAAQEKIINAYNKEALVKFDNMFSRQETWESIKLEDVAKLGTNINEDVLSKSPFLSKMPQLISNIAKQSGFKLDDVKIKNIGYAKDGNSIVVEFFANNKKIPDIILLPVTNPKDGFVQALITGVQKEKDFQI